MVGPGAVNPAARALVKTVLAAADVPFRIRPGPRILIYHQVGSGLGRQMEVTTDAFEFQLNWLMEHGSIVNLDEALERSGEPNSHRLFVLTFDDGYRDVHDTAFPLLRSAQVPFLVYATTEPIETGRATTPGGQAEPLTWNQLTEMAEAGATIGSHTHTHPDLRVTPAEVVEMELAQSDLLIERRLGIKSEHFCYPYGYWSVTAEPAVRGRYRTATLGAGPPVSPSSDPHRIHRVPVQLGDGKFFFTRKMKSGMVHEETLRRRVAGYRGV
ncbi:MAG: polysaccharide deacetylase family protein [Acidimicrobiia bacterium]